MHIIKITPRSFKVILTKEDFEKYGEENIFENTNIKNAFFTDILKKAGINVDDQKNYLTVDAEFFEGKDGGGELFVNTRRNLKVFTTYIFSGEDFENIVLLCKRMAENLLPYDSKLFKLYNTYYLALIYEKPSDIVVSIIREYGKADRKNYTFIWFLEEHARTILKKNAVQTLSCVFS